MSTEAWELSGPQKMKSMAELAPMSLPPEAVFAFCFLIKHIIYFVFIYYVCWDLENTFYIEYMYPTI